VEIARPILSQKLLEDFEKVLYLADSRLMLGELNFGSHLLSTFLTLHEVEIEL
jgi:hypothetical protein